MRISFIEIDPELANSFLDSAERGDYINVVEMLNAGMLVDVCDEYGITALMQAAENSHTDITRVLLHKGADVNKRNCFDRTALHWATLTNSIDIIKMLLEHGASTNIKDNFGRTPLDIAREYNKKDSVHLLVLLSASCHGSYFRLDSMN